MGEAVHEIIKLAQVNPLAACVLAMILVKGGFDIGLVAHRKLSGRNGTSTLHGQLDAMEKKMDEKGSKLDVIDAKMDEQTEKLIEMLAAIRERVAVVEETTRIIERHCPLMSPERNKP